MPLSRLLPRTRKTSQKTSVALGLSACALLLVALGYELYTRTRPPVVQNINYTELRRLSEDANIKTLTVDGEVLTVTRADGTLAQAIVTNTAAQQEIINAFDHQHVAVEFRSLAPGLVSNLFNWGFSILMLVLLAFVGWRVYVSLGGGQGGGF